MGQLVRSYRCLPLLAVVMGMILVSPLTQASPALRMVIGIGWAVGFGFASYLVFPRRFWLNTYLLLVVLIVAIQLLEAALELPAWTGYLAPILAFAIHLAAFYAILRHALLAKVNNEFDRTIAAITGYFLLALIWTRIYQLIVYIDPGAFLDRGAAIPFTDEHTFVYFSLISLTTVGYGDITPVNEYARLLGGIEGAVGTLFIAVVIASLIGRLMSSRTHA